jgi:hypothetical protein
MLPEPTRRRFPVETISPKGRAVLDVEIPDGYPPEKAARLAALVESKLPHLTIAATSGMQSVHGLEAAEADRKAIEHQRFIEGEYARQPAPMRIALQAGAHMVRGLPSVGGWSTRQTENIPPPRTAGERLAAAAGGILPYAVEGGIIATGVGAIPGATALAAPLAAGLPAAAQEGTPKARVARGAAMALAGTAGSLAGEALTGVVTGGARAVESGAAAAGERALAATGSQTIAREAAKAAAERIAAEHGPIAAAVAHATGLGAFGGVAPYAEHVAMKAVGEPTEFPHWDDVAQGLGELGLIGLAHGGMNRSAELTRRAMDRGRAEVPATPEQPTPTTAPPIETREGQAIARRPTPVVRPAGPSPEFPAMDEPTKIAVLGIAKGNGQAGRKGRLANSEPNPIDGNRTPLKGFADRLGEYVKQGVAPVEAAKRARREVVGLKMLHDAVTPPFGGTPDEIATGRQMSVQLLKAAGGKPLTLTDEAGKPIGGEVLTISVYPWAEEQVRVVLRDAQTGQVVPLFFKDLAEFESRTVARAAQLELEPSTVDTQVASESIGSGPAVAKPSGRGSAVEVVEAPPKGGPAQKPEPGTPKVQPEREPTPAPQAAPEGVEAKVDRFFDRRGGDVEDVVRRQSEPPRSMQSDIQSPRAAAKPSSEKNATTVSTREAEQRGSTGAASFSDAMLKSADSKVSRAANDLLSGREGAAERLALAREQQKIVYAKAGRPLPTSEGERARARAEVPPASSATREAKAEVRAPKFQPKQQVRVPPNPEWKRAKRSYRGTVVNYQPPDAKGEPQVLVHVVRGGGKGARQEFSKVTGKSSVPKGRAYTYTVPESKIRRVLSPKERAANAAKEYEGPYRRMTLQAGGDPEAAREMVAELEARQREINDAGPNFGEPGYEARARRYRDTGRQILIAEQVLREAESGPSEGSGLREVGAAIRAHFDKAPDRAQATELAAEHELTVPDVAALSASLKRVRRVAEAVSPNTLHRVAGRAVIAESRFADEARALAAEKKAGLQSAAPEERNATRSLMESLTRDLKTAKRIREGAEEQIKAAHQRYAADKPELLADLLFKTQEWVDQQLAASPLGNERGAITVFSDMAAAPGSAARWVSRKVGAGIARAVRKQIAKGGRGSNDARIVDRDGRTLDRMPMNEYLDDPYSNSASTRIMSKLLMTGGAKFLTPRLRDSWQASYASHPMFEEHFGQMWMKAMGSPEAARYFAAYGTGSIELGRALRGETHSIPSQHRGAVARVKAMLDDVHKLLVEHAEATGQEPPAYRKDYAHPHIIEGQRSSRLSKLLEAIELRKTHEIGDLELSERHNRFYERREGDPNFLRDATLSIDTYLAEASKKLAWDSFLKHAYDYLKSDVANFREKDRANLVRDFVRATMLRKKNRFESFFDDGLRRLYFAKTREGIQDAPLDVVQKALRMSESDLALRGADQVSWVPPGVAYRAPADAVELGKSADGGTYVGYSRGGVVFSNESPMPRKLVKNSMLLFTDKMKTLLGQMHGENDFRRRAKVDDAILRLERDPFAITVEMLRGGMSRAVMGYNVRATNVNAGGTLVTTLPEYGLMPFVAGAAGAGKAVAARLRRAALNAAINHAERTGYLRAEDAEASRKLLPLLKEEVYAEAAGSSQGEAQAARQRIRDVMEGRSPKLMAVLRALGPFGMFGAAEGWNRTLDVIAADHYARNTLGLEGKAPQLYESLQQAREQMLKAMGEPGSAERFSAGSVATTQFAYNALGQPMWANNPAGKLIFHLGTWPLNYAQNYVVRPTAGAFRVGMAAARGAINAMTGDRLGARSTRREGKKFIFRGSHPEPKNWFEQWLEYNGAGHAERHASAVFVRQMAVSSVLIGLSQALGANVAVYGVAPQAVAALWMLRQFFPDDDAIAEWYKTGKYGAAWGASRGLPVGPTVGLGVDIGTKAWQRIQHAGSAEGRERENIGPATYFPWDLVLHAVRRELVTGDVELQRLIRENPERFENVPWVYKAFGIKRAEYDLEPGQRVRHHLGLTSPSEDRSAERRVPEP